jgi:citrate synthase
LISIFLGWFSFVIFTLLLLSKKIHLMEQNALIKVGDNEIQLPVTVGTEQEQGIDISKLRGGTGVVTYDPGFKNTGSCKSAITFLDGEKGILRYRGYSIEDLAAKATFMEVSYLLINGELPNKSELVEFEKNIMAQKEVDQNIKKIYEAYPDKSHPMGVLASVVCSLSAFYPTDEKESSINLLLGKLPTISAWAFKSFVGKDFVEPKEGLSFIENFLHMMFSTADKEYEINPVVVSALDKLLILHADHEQNCSTSTVRIVGSSHASLHSSVSAGINALWGPLHGGANQAVIEMLEEIHTSGTSLDSWVARAKDKSDSFRLMGFGHRVYKNFDPRATIIKVAVDEVLDALGIEDPLIEIAKQLEQVALNDEYFKARNLYPNVDFYSGIIYKALGIPTEMFTVMFALGRMPGWIAQWDEMMKNGEPIGRPRQIYIGEKLRAYKELSAR